MGWGEEPPDRPTNGYSEYNVPVLSWNDGRISVCHLPPQVREAAEIAGTSLDGAVAEALNLFARMCEREDIVLTLALDEGQAYFINNYNTLHARNALGLLSKRCLLPSGKGPPGHGGGWLISIG